MNLYTKLAHLRIGKMNSKEKVKEKTWLSDKTSSFALNVRWMSLILILTL